VVLHFLSAYRLAFLAQQKMPLPKQGHFLRLLFSNTSDSKQPTVHTVPAAARTSSYNPLSRSCTASRHIGLYIENYSRQLAFHRQDLLS
jgi:hypothetical protein